jgi:hypothetical protein
MTSTDATETNLEQVQGGRLRRLRRLGGVFPTIDLSSPALTWIGLVIAAAGFAMIAFSWGKVAALLDVSRQLPYVVSGGLTGLALVMVGMTAVNVAARRHDASERAQQIEQLQGVLRELRETLEQ